jgi:formylglycine-generating enzyme required for sulfatase activity
LDSHYWLYGTTNNSTPIVSGPTAFANHANYNDVVNALTDVGAYSGTTSPYGAYDIAGNVFQWNEEAFVDGYYRGLRGGAYPYDSSYLQSSYIGYTFPSTENDGMGFRVASVPEPSTAALAVVACGTMCGLRRRFAG